MTELEALSDRDLLTLLWNDTDAADNALREFGDLRTILSTKPKELHDRGIGLLCAAQASAVMELARRSLLQTLAPRTMLVDPAATKRFFLAWLRDRAVEQFCAIFVDNRHRVIAAKTLWVGTIDGAAVYPREVLTMSLDLGAAAVIFAHNHPSGVAEPSDADRRMTRRLRDALALVDIRVLDHLVVGDGAVVSFAERGLI